ncbi:transmembrane protein [Holotrichia oblita]|uniref:Transmembrane protein n=1 Tax=Holotrichia oblita TaxID=644536 RepID=A0ACB9T6V3_HOLOL|nr:transmembrane protein [Holotrichia oblita]
MNKVKSKKSRQKEEIKQEIVAQVHKPVKQDLGSDRETQKADNSDDSTKINKNYLVEDNNENYTVSTTPVRDVSDDGDVHINSKILNLIESEMRRDSNKQSHFTDSRPQSLSFYEEEKMPEELSGNLELLSPEEKKHYKKRKDHAQLDNEERNIYNSIQDIYNREGDEIITGKKSKSRKKKHADNEMGMGDSREMMIPKEKRKTALEDLQDDVFENNAEDFIKHEKIRKSPRKSDKLYVQKKNKFEVTNRPTLMRSSTIDPDAFKRNAERPLQTAMHIQKYWIPFTTFCHGLLGGLAFAHSTYLHCNRNTKDVQYIIHYANYSDIYTCIFYALCVICLISVFDRYDIASIKSIDLQELVKHRKGCAVIFLYVATMIVHLVTAKVDDKMSLVLYNNITQLDMTDFEVSEWYNLSLEGL